MPKFGQKISERPMEASIRTRLEPYVLGKARRQAEKEGTTVSGLIRSLLAEKLKIPEYRPDAEDCQ